jgi:hypothetical protein
MTRIKYAVRTVFFVLAVFLLAYLSRKTDDSAGTIAEFKFKMIEKIRTDSLDSKQKMDLLLEETTKFIDDSSYVRKGIRYLMGLLGLVVVVEMVFLVQAKRNLDSRNPGK